MFTAAKALRHTLALVSVFVSSQAGKRQSVAGPSAVHTSAALCQPWLSVRRSTATLITYVAVHLIVVPPP